MLKQNRKLKGVLVREQVLNAYCNTPILVLLMKNNKSIFKKMI